MENLFTREKIYSVTNLTRTIRNKLENDRELNGIWIIGEISNLTLHSSGHIYFSLKDDNAVISAVFFKNANRKLNFRLEEGMSVFAFGGVTVYEKRGSYQFNVSMLRLEGIGELQKRIDQLKQALLKEGLFDPSRKKPVPLLPRKIGVVTSPTGAAFRDIVKVAVRRFPNIEIVLAPAIVQGADAASSIVKGIEELNRPEWKIDVIIAGRGGGSFEDLMPFNEEIVVRAFYNSTVPIISAVGHQIDHPLSDDAADIAAPTPSAAAEIAVPLKKDFIDEIVYCKIRLNNSIVNTIRNYRMRVGHVISRRIFRDPMEHINYRSLMLADLENKLLSSMKNICSHKSHEFMQVPDISLLMEAIMMKKRNRFEVAIQSLEKLSPLGILRRGYAIAVNERNRVIKKTGDASTGENIRVRIIDGTIHCIVKSTSAGE